MRDQKTEDIKALIGQGCKVKMDGTGNILVKRLARSPVYVKNTVYEENAVSNDILKLPNSGLLEPIDKPFKLFDMKKFQQVCTFSILWHILLQNVIYTKYSVILW